MTESPKRIRITVGGIQLEAELKNTKTAAEVYAALPVQAPINAWGEEFYFKIPGVKDYRETATTQVKVGDVAFWGAVVDVAAFASAAWGAVGRASGNGTSRRVGRTESRGTAASSPTPG